MPTEPVPSAHTGGSGVVMPRRWAMSATFCGPTCSASRANTAFTEYAVASYRFSMPRLVPSAFVTFHTEPSWLKHPAMGPWAPENVAVGGMPCSNAVARMYGLNDDP